jgi:hypothetical protein
MAVYKAARIGLRIMSDGTTGTFTVKLATDGDPYWVGEASEAGIRGTTVENWFSQPNAANAPKQARLVEGGGANSVSLSVPTSVLTVNFTPAPNGVIQMIFVELLFA